MLNNSMNTLTIAAVAVKPCSRVVRDLFLLFDASFRRLIVGSSFLLIEGSIRVAFSPPVLPTLLPIV
jgi:hypothetical protein